MKYKIIIYYGEDIEETRGIVFSTKEQALEYYEMLLDEDEHRIEYREE